MSETMALSTIMDRLTGWDPGYRPHASKEGDREESPNRDGGRAGRLRVDRGRVRRGKDAGRRRKPDGGPCVRERAHHVWRPHRRILSRLQALRVGREGGP